MKAKETIARIESIIYTGFEWICRVILVFITLLIAVQVFLRAAFRYSIPWSEEVSLMGFIYITFFSMAIAVRHDQHLRVELFVSKFPRAGKKAIDLIDNIVMLAISIMMFYTGIKLVQYGMSSIISSVRIRPILKIIGRSCTAVPLGKTRFGAILTEPLQSGKE